MTLLLDRPTPVTALPALDTAGSTALADLFRLATAGPAGGLPRRGFLAGGLGVAGTLLLGACGDDSERTPDAGGSPGQRQVQTDKGEVTVPANPARVVCADYYGAFAVVDLGLVPVGVSGGGYDGTGDTYAPKLAETPVVGDWTEPDVEKVAGAEPDLILRTIDTPDDLYDQLSRIAPTVVISFQQLSLLEVASRIGEVLGRGQQADELLSRYRSHTSGIKQKHQAVLDRYTFTFVQVASDTTFWTLGPKWTDTTVLVDSGLRLAEPANSQPEPTKEYSMEQIGILEPTGVLLIPSGPDGVTPAPDSAALTDSALWKQLPAVRAGRVYPILSGAASLGTGLELTERIDTVLTELTTAG
ncbi:ABC transporter substrate-binding protein [Micromonospora sp. WMMD1082]|uniref:ABC transporter substrate-binding protein n=1 Tax=Micromonospora sp. WMMD1082 TaxID=3016104 RepID=UPI00241652A0|nr:ABC transporter substrate-binding protein [Micromonospora sp. WMMD1082]MDG4795654.1 ABC transporter substrate-binding protein [Micromonospora sp. WMMD1082]